MRPFTAFLPLHSSSIPIHPVTPLSTWTISLRSEEHSNLSFEALYNDECLNHGVFFFLLVLLILREFESLRAVWSSGRFWLVLGFENFGNICLMKVFFIVESLVLIEWKFNDRRHNSSIKKYFYRSVTGVNYITIYIIYNRFALDCLRFGIYLFIYIIIVKYCIKWLNKNWIRNNQQVFSISVIHQNFSRFSSLSRLEINRDIQD